MAVFGVFFGFFRLPQMEIEKKTICKQIVSVARLTFVEWTSALKEEGKKDFESKHHDVKVKSLK